MKLLQALWDRITAWVLIIAGFIALIVGWVGVSGSAFPAEQIPYVVSGGLLGLFLLGIGATLWISADLRDEWRKLDRIEEAARAGGVPRLFEGSPGNGSNRVSEMTGARADSETLPTENDEKPAKATGRARKS